MQKNTLNITQNIRKSHRTDPLRRLNKVSAVANGKPDVSAGGLNQSDKFLPEQSISIEAEGKNLSVYFPFYLQVCF